MKKPERKPILPHELKLPVVEVFDRRWLLLTAGENRPKKYNAMTVSWGSLGVLWNKPVAFVFVRPSRYTYRFIDQGSSFTLCVFPAECKDKLTLCGTKSGRTCDKIKECGFTPIASQDIETPAFDEAELILECRKIYFADIQPANFLSDEIEGNYGGSDYHRMFIGEIVCAEGTAAYRLSA
jgi:flavin reductase (DIM6/NTAB) family NADH-FMN oxidoreductase RutF